MSERSEVLALYNKPHVINDEKNDYETTQEHFEKFQASVLKYIKLFGLYEWHVSFCHKEIKGALATCGGNTQGKTVCFSLATEWKHNEPTDMELDLSAFHEVMELMLYEYDDIIGDTDLSIALKREWRERVDHTVIRRLENIILPRLQRSSRQNISISVPKDQADWKSINFNGQEFPSKGCHGMKLTILPGAEPTLSFSHYCKLCEKDFWSKSFEDSLCPDCIEA